MAIYLSAIILTYLGLTLIDEIINANKDERNVKSRAVRDYEARKASSN